MDEFIYLTFAGVIHTVVSGDTVPSLARFYQVEEEEIREANGLADDLLTVGDELIVPGAKPPQEIREAGGRILSTALRIFTTALTSPPVPEPQLTLPPPEK